MLLSSVVFLEVFNVTPTYRKSWAKNLLMWSDFTLGSSFKVKRLLICVGGFLSSGYNLHRFSDVLCLVFHVLSDNFTRRVFPKQALFGITTGIIRYCSVEVFAAILGF